MLIRFFSVAIFSLVLVGCVNLGKQIKVSDIKAINIVNFGSNQMPLMTNYSMNDYGFGIKFFGDSHFASDDTINSFRKNFFNQNSIGFVLPIMPRFQKSENLSYSQHGFTTINSRLEDFDDYPLCGVVAWAQNAGASMNLGLKQLSGEFEFEILHKGSVNGEILNVKDATNKEFIISQNMQNSWEYSKFSVKFPLIITTLQDDIYLGGYKIFKSQNAKFADSCALNGAFSHIHRKWSQDAFIRDFDELNYDLFVIAYGTNDAMDKDLDIAKFSKGLQELIDKLRISQPSARFLLISPPPSPKAVRVSDVRHAVMRLAQTNRTMYFDLRDFIEANGGWSVWKASGLVKNDDIHFTKAGYEKIGEILANALKNRLEN